jgi:hypothetical protein
MVEVMSIAVSGDDQWLVVNGRPVEYYSSDTAFLNGKKVWAAEAAASRLAEALVVEVNAVDFATAGFPDAIVGLPSGSRMLVHGAISLGALGLDASDPADIQEEDLVILARELISRANAGGSGVEPIPDAEPVAVEA